MEERNSICVKNLLSHVLHGANVVSKPKGYNMFNLMNRQYAAFQTLIVQNARAIKALLDQVKELNTLIENSQKEEFKDEIKKRQDAMYDTIDKLLSSTEGLFEQYKKALNK